MRFFSKNIDLYNIGQWARRAGVRMMGLVVALFASARAEAYDYIKEACPGCQWWADSICDTTQAQRTFDDGIGTGVEYQYCVPTSNHSSPLIVDSGCVELLNSWGMCADSAALANPDLNCVSGVEQIGYTVSYGATSYYMSSSVSGYAEFLPNDTGAVNYSAICCDTNSGIGTQQCCGSTGNCLEDLMYGYCRGNWITVDLNETGDNVTMGQTCTQAFQAYFSDADNSSGWCDGEYIYVEGTGALLISQACYGQNVINDSASGLVTYCGVVLTSCNGDSGYYLGSKEPSPGLFGSSGYTSNDYCESCPTDVAPDVPFEYPEDMFVYSGVYVDSNGSGITACRLPVKYNPYSWNDGTGDIEYTFDGDCVYTE